MDKPKTVIEKIVGDPEAARPDVWHIVDIGINHGRTHTLCGIEMTWGFHNMRPKNPDKWCERCQELDG